MKKVDSSILAMDSKETSAIAARYPLFSKEATLCHALPCKARNDRLNFWKTLKMWLLKMPKDSRICDEKSGLSSDWQGSYLSGNDRRQSRRIHDLSRKAESTSETK